ncbi:MAG TPA: serine/threonine-protein kinase [Gemmatales bacterium]|nr:serine/threonine-protein kinase [Gemmatales bacterium]
MIGERVGPWIVEKLLGRGGMGEVYRAREVANSSSHVALKFLSPELSARQAERFDREVEALRRLQHENIVHLLDAGQWGDRSWYAMEYVDGMSLAELLEQRGPIPHEEVLKIAIQICKALTHAHQQEMVHRDLKPSNLLLSRDGVIKLADFGVAKLFGMNSLSAADAVIGTADYVSPEQAAGKPVTRRSDIYALGVVLYQLLTSRLPFSAETAAEMLKAHRHAHFTPPSHYVTDLPPAWDDIIAHLMDKDPERRPASAGAVADLLLSLQRKLQRQRPYTVDAVRNQPTKNIGAAADEQRLAQGRLEPLEPAPPPPTSWARVLLMVAILALLIVIVVWGLRPTSPDELSRKVDALLQDSDWIGAEMQLAKLRDRLGSQPDAAWRDKLDDFEERLRQGQQLSRLRRDMGGLAFSAPSSEAERLFRRGVVEFLAGQAEAARSTWQNLIGAYRGVPSQAGWVALAETALREADKRPDAAAAIREAVAQARSEPAGDAVRRLKTLRLLYTGEAATSPDIQAELAKLDELLRELEK